MTRDILDKANQLEYDIHRLKNFIYDLERKRKVYLFGKPKPIGVTICEYMTESEYYELDKNMRLKLIELLKTELKELENQFQELKGE